MFLYQATREKTNFYLGKKNVTSFLKSAKIFQKNKEIVQSALTGGIRHTQGRRSIHVACKIVAIDKGTGRYGGMKQERCNRTVGDEQALVTHTDQHL